MDKQWAEGLNQEEFSRQWVMIYPKCDVIPDVNKWLNRKERKPTGIDPFNEEMIEGEHHINKAKPKKVEEDNLGGFSVECDGCGEIYIKDSEKKAATAIRSHQRFCKELLKKR